MNIAVTGATGFIGRYIVRQLVANGHRCHCWFRPESDRSGFEDVAESLEWIQGGLGEANACRELLAGCDAVVHSALYHPSGNFVGDQDDLRTFVEKNLLGSLELIETARAAGVPRFVFISTCAVYDKILDDRPLDEKHPMWTASHYGAYKAAVEEFVYSYGLGHGYEICALRPTGVYGVAYPASQSKWFELVQAVVQGQKVTCKKGGKEVHAADVAKAASILLTVGGIAGEAYNCYDLYVSEWDVAQLAKEFAGSSSQIQGGQTQPKHQIVTEKLRRLGLQFGSRPQLEQTIADLVAAVKLQS
jgi:nucleoside-diphosphate-sugar epimerase